MAKICTLLGFLLAGATALGADSHHGDHGDPAQAAEVDTTLLNEHMWVQGPAQTSLGRRLGLTTEQQMLLDEMRTQLQDRLDNLSTQVELGRLNGFRARQAFQQALEEYRKNRRAMLSPEQLNLLEYHHDSFASPLAQAPNLVDALGLSGDQRDQWLQLLQQQRLEFRQLKESGVTPTLGMARDFALAHRLAFEALLDQEQLDHLRALRKSMMPLGDPFFEEDGLDPADGGLSDPTGNSPEAGYLEGSPAAEEEQLEKNSGLGTEEVQPDPAQDY